MPEQKELSAEDIYRHCDPGQFDFETTDDLPPAERIIGQKRAVSAINFGLDIESKGYNLYLAGLPGTGRTSLIQIILSSTAKEKTSPQDICLVNNYQDPDKPQVLYLPPGLARELKKDMEELIEELRRAIVETFESKWYEEQQNEALHEQQKKSADLLAGLQKKAGQEGLQFQITPAGVVTRVVKDGKALSQEQYGALPEEEKEAIRRKVESFNQEVSALLDQVKEIERQARDKIRDLEKKTATIIVEGQIKRLEEKYPQQENVARYLQQVQQSVLEHIADFRGQQQESSSAPNALKAINERSRFIAYQVNILVDNSTAQGAPIIIEPNPTYTNLFGAIEREVHFGALVTNFTMIKTGSLVRANGGYLIIEAADLFKYPLVWDTLKRSMETGEVRIEDPAVQFGILGATGLRPEPIKIDVKVVLIGSPMLQHLLYAYDDDFQKLFKVKADFDSQMDRRPENVKQYAQFAKACCVRGCLQPFDRSGVAALVEYGSRLAEDQTKLSTKFGEVADLMTEASYWASRSESRVVRRQDVEKAVEEKIYRSNRIEERIQEMIAREVILVDTAGAIVGQVNGLSVLNIGDYQFGKPVRITCQTSAGKAGVVNIEGRAKLSGKIHNKAVMILSGYLAAKFAQDQPLSLSAQLAFEQTYEGIEGDSASIAEVVVLLSSLAAVPIQQSLAVTGSINQKGQVQPIGGVNEKIEGFFTVCKTRGLTGDQGIIIPHQNVENLMLKKEVVEAVRNKQFHIYPVNVVEQAAALLTGMEAGQRDEAGQYKPETLYSLVEQRLKELAERAKEESGKDKEEENEENQRAGDPSVVSEISRRPFSPHGS